MSAIIVTRDDLVELLTRAATIGRNEAASCQTRGEITRLIEIRFSKTLDALFNGSNDND